MLCGGCIWQIAAGTAGLVIGGECERFAVLGCGIGDIGKSNDAGCGCLSSRAGERAWCAGCQGDGVGEVGVDTAVGVLCLHDGLRRKQAARDDVSVGGSRISWQAGKDHFSSDDVDREFVANDVR